MAYNQRRLSPMNTLYKMICMNTTILSIQSGGNRLPARRSINTNLHFQRHKLCSFSSLSKSLGSNFTSRVAVVKKCSSSGGGSYVKSNFTCHKCGNKVYIQKDCRSKGTGSSGNPPNKSTNELSIMGH